MTQKSLNFVVTRPINRATNLVDGLNRLAKSHSTELSPSITIKHYPLISIVSHIETVPSNLDKFDGVIFISGNAIDQAKNQLTELDWKNLLSNKLFAIGEQTAKVLRTDLENFDMSANASVYYPSQMNSEGLLKMSELANINGQSWIIVKGVGGRETLKLGLQQAGAKVTEFSVYQRKLPDLMAQKEIESYNQVNTVWLITSVQALSNLSRLLNRKTRYHKIIVSSDRISQEANKQGFKVMAQSIDATDKQLIACVRQYISNIQ